MKTKIIIAVITILSFSYGFGQKRMTSFTPQKHGFKFSNDGFKPYLGDAGSISIDFSGFCGGMTYAAGDYYYKGIPIPNQDYTPAPGTDLYGYIYSRQSKSIENIAGQVVEYTINIGGSRNDEFWRWGVNEKLRQLVGSINSGRPTPILLLRKDKSPADNHWVMAIGYDLGGYTWKKENDPKVNNIKIFIYDPNHPNTYMVLKPNKIRKEFLYGTYDFVTRKFSKKDNWDCRTFHPNINFYKDVKTPKNIQKIRKGGRGKVYQLVVRCKTGGDDLRGGNDRVSFKVKFRDGTYDVFKNASLSQRWPKGSIVNVELPLTKLRDLNEIKSVEISTNFGGGIGGDNWNLNSMSVNAYKDNGTSVPDITGTHSGRPWKRFTGERKRMEVRSEHYKPVISNNSGNRTTLAIDINNIKTAIHNNDCRRLQGDICVRLVNKRTGREYRPVSGNVLLNWKGNKTRDFAFRSFETLPTNEVRFLVDKNVVDSRLYKIILYSNNLKRCHKSCDFCSGYNCKMRYDGVTIDGSQLTNTVGSRFYQTVADMKIKGYPKNDHALKIDLRVTQ